MILLLLWIELVTAVLLIVALEAAFAARRKRIAAALLMTMGMATAVAMIAAQLLPVIAYRFTRLDAPAAWVGGIGVVLVLLGAIGIEVAALRRNGAGLRKGALWPVRRIAAAAGLCVALLVMTFWNMTLQAQLEIQALRIQAGTVALQIVPSPVPAGENAAPLYAEGSEVLKSASPSAESGAQAEYESLDPASPAAAEYLDRQQRALALFRQAADRPSCRLGYNYFADYHEWSQQTESVLHNLLALRTAAKLLAFAAQVEAARGDMPDALADLERIYRTVAHAEESPLIISGLVGIAVDEVGTDTLAKLLPQVRTASDLEKLPPLDPAAMGAAFAKTLRGEELFATATFCDAGLGAGTFSTPVLTRGGGAIAWFLWFSEDFSLYLRNIHAFEHQFEKPYYEGAALRERFEKEIEPTHRHGFLSAIVMPSFSRMAELVARGEAMRACANVAVDITRYRLQHGSYPDMPTQLPVDPFDGKPLRYKKHADGSVTIYSVGKDLKDGGGDVARTQGKTPADIGITLSFPSGAATKP